MRVKLLVRAGTDVHVNRILKGKEQGRTENRPTGALLLLTKLCNVWVFSCKKKRKDVITVCTSKIQLINSGRGVYECGSADLDPRNA